MVHGHDGDQRVYFQSAGVSGLIANDATDRSVYSAVATINKSYYLTTSTDTPAAGTWSKGTILGYFHWDKSGKWLTAFMGGQRVFFIPDSLDTLSKRTSSDRTAYALRSLSLAQVPYYNAPSVNATRLGTFKKEISLGGIHWDGSWMQASMGAQTVYFRVVDLVYDLDTSSPAAENGLAFENVPYFSRPDAGSDKQGDFAKGTHLGFVRYDLGGKWYTATMGSKGRVYFSSQYVAKLPERNHEDQSAHSAYATEKVPYYEMPSTLSEQVGTFSKGTRLGFIHWDAANPWYRARMGGNTVYFEFRGLDVLPDRDHSSVAVHLSYALEDVPYYSDVYTKSRKLGVFRKGTMPGLVYYDRGRSWATASMGNQRVYFPTANLAIIPPNNANDGSARGGKTTSTVTYYEAPTTRSKVLGHWRAGTDLGFFRWDAPNQWYWAYMGNQRVYFPAASIKRLVTPETVIGIARGGLGTVGGWKYLNAAYGPNYYVAWCATFQWWVFYQAGASDLFFGGGVSASPLQILNYYRSTGQEVGSPRPGDLVFMSVTAHASHIGLVTAVSGNRARIAEGNWGCRVNERWIGAWGGSGYVVAYARPN